MLNFPINESICNRASKNLDELSERANKSKVTSVRLTSLWRSRLSCSLSHLAIFPDVGVLTRSDLRRISLYRHPSREYASILLLRSSVQSRGDPVKLLVG